MSNETRPPPPNQIDSPPHLQDRLANQDWAGVAKTGIGAMSPADKGWILAFVVIFAVFQLSNYLVAIKREEAESLRAERLTSYFQTIEQSRTAIEDNRAQEIRRLQEIVKELTQTVARQTDRAGRTARESELIDRTKAQP